MSLPRLLFICKKRTQAYTCEAGTGYSTPHFSSGLFNSARLVVERLVHLGYEAKLIEVIDNNCIDREVTAYRPDVVVLEAYWVVPTKFEVLTRLHPTVNWIIRNHSNMPFLAQEGIAIEWTLQYVQYANVYVACNTVEARGDMVAGVSNALHLSNRQASEYVLYFPNYYAVAEKSPFPRQHAAMGAPINIGCFGAIRPLKNHLEQAFAAIKLGQMLKRPVKFHINATRLEGRGEPVLKSLRALFATGDVELVEHSWMPHTQFLELMSTMDISFQVSFTETFNIVTADAVAVDVPVVVSDDIKWISQIFSADPTSSTHIAWKARLVLWLEPLGIARFNKWCLQRYNHKSDCAIQHTIHTVFDA